MTDRTQPQSREQSSIKPATPETAHKLCDRLAATMAELIQAIEHETALVRKGKLSAAGNVQTRKVDLARQYVLDMDEVKASSAVLGRLVPDRVEELRHRHGEFRALLQINLAVLATAREVSEDILRSVAKKVGARDAPNTYDPAGDLGNRRDASASGIALDTSL